METALTLCLSFSNGFLLRREGLDRSNLVSLCLINGKLWTATAGHEFSRKVTELQHNKHFIYVSNLRSATPDILALRGVDDALHRAASLIASPRSTCGSSSPSPYR